MKDDFPWKQLMIMAALDMLQLSGLIISAAGIPPTMTVVLLHISTPCIVFGSRYVFPLRQYSALQTRGIVIIIFAISISLFRPCIGLMFGRKVTSFIRSAIIYSLSASLQGFSMLYKEYVIISWKQPPVEIYYLSTWLFTFQLIFVLIFSPLIYISQSVTSNNPIGFPIHSYFTNIYDGIHCLFGYEPQVFSSQSWSRQLYDTHYNICDNSINIWLIIFYILSNICILECINRLLKMRQDLLIRSMSIAIFMAFIALGIYDSKVNYGFGLFNTNIGVLDIISLVVLLIGMEVYGRETEPDQAIPMYQYENSSRDEINRKIQLAQQ